MDEKSPFFLMPDSLFLPFILCHFKCWQIFVTDRISKVIQLGKKIRKTTLFQVRSSDHQPSPQDHQDASASKAKRDGRWGRQEEQSQAQHPHVNVCQTPCSIPSTSPIAYQIQDLTVFTLKVPACGLKQENTHRYVYAWFGCQAASKWERTFEAKPLKLIAL